MEEGLTPEPDSREEARGRDEPPAPRRGHVPFLGAATIVATTGINALTLLLVARGGRIGEVGTYTVGTVTIAIIAVILSAGTTLRYLAAGSDEILSTLRLWRYFVVVPTLVAASLVTAVVFDGLGYDFVGVLLAALSVSVANAMEVPTTGLQRELRYGLAGVVQVGGRLLALVLATVAGMSLPAGLFVANAVQAVALEVVASRDAISASLRLIPRLRSPRQSLAPIWVGRHLGLVTTSEYFGNRFDSFVLGLTSGSRTVGRYAVVYSIYQSLLSALAAALGSGLVLRRLPSVARTTNGVIARASRFTKLENVGAVTLALSVPVAVFLAVFAEPILDLFSLDSSDPVLWLRLLAISVPAYVFSRAVMLMAVAVDRFDIAARTVGLAVLLGAVAVVILVPTLGPIGGVYSTVGQEIAASALAIVALSSLATTPNPNAKPVSPDG